MEKIIERQGRRIILLGTAHISQQSIQDVDRAIETYKPDSVCVELCPSRFESIKNADSWKEMDIVKVVKGGKAPLLMANLILTAFQKKMGDQLGVKPGAEMVEAVNKAEEVGSKTVLIDREVSQTLKRAWGSISLWQKTKLASQLFSSLFENPEIDETEIEELKEADMLNEAIYELGKEMPPIKETLIDERDQYMAQKINEAPGETILAVVGAGHMAGIERNLELAHDLERLSQTPPPSMLLKFFKWFLPLLVIGIIGYGFATVDTEVSMEMILRWVLANGILAGLGALIAGGHVLTVIIAFLAAPITSLNPAVAAGWVSGLTEAWLRKPKVEDFENLHQDITSFSGFRKNEITRILMVVVFSNLGSSIGTFVGIPLITSLL